MHATSRPVASNQPHLHPKLAATVFRHLASVSRKPVAAHNLAAFNLLMDELRRSERPLVLDSFCGTGHSTIAIARQHPRHLIVGIDKSATRLGRHPGACEGQNYLLLQAECEDIWRQLVEAGVGVDYHYLLYPNPWPKAKHLQRRVHGGASFRWLLQLGSRARPCRVELRSNWQTYIEEFGMAAHLADCRGRVARYSPSEPLSLFEQKYRASGHSLWRFTGSITGLSLPAHRDVMPQLG